MTPPRRGISNTCTDDTAPPKQGANDGSHASYLTRTSRKRTEGSDADLAFERTASPFAKRAVLRTTPEKMKQHVNETTTGWLLDQIDTISTSKGFSERQRKYTDMFKGLMLPTGPALDHPAAPLLLELATLGCTTAIDGQWSMDMLEAAIAQGAHPSALVPDAAAQLRAETLEKVEQGYARLVTWAELRHNPPPNLKISPIAAVPHKSRGFRMILDLSHGITVNGIRHPSVNESTTPNVAPTVAMQELGHVLPRLIYAVATAPSARGPILFSKLDVKDGYWRLVVPEDDEWHFAYVLPKASPDEPTQLVIPSCLQMGWCDSPAYFCAASETARDVAEELAQHPRGSLPEHPLEGYLVPPGEWPDDTIEQQASDFVKLLEVYVDDFIQLAQTENRAQLEHLSRAILHAIHSVFPPPAVTGHNGEDPIALKKLKEGDGLWSVRKEILGWVFDGAKRCIELPTAKVDSILQDIHSMCRR
jgi:hypothetical protein